MERHIADSNFVSTTRPRHRMYALSLVAAVAVGVAVPGVDALNPNSVFGSELRDYGVPSGIAMYEVPVRDGTSIFAILGLPVRQQPGVTTNGSSSAGLGLTSPWLGGSTAATPAPTGPTPDGAAAPTSAVGGGAGALGSLLGFGLFGAAAVPGDQTTPASVAIGFEALSAQSRTFSPNPGGASPGPPVFNTPATSVPRTTAPTTVATTTTSATTTTTSATTPTTSAITPTTSATTTTTSATTTTTAPVGSGLTAGEIVLDSNRAGAFQIFLMASDGSNVRQLTSGAGTDAWWPRPSPDRRTIIFYRTPAGVHDSDYSRTELWSMNADGSNQRKLRAAGQDGWGFQGHAEWSPRGDALVMFGGASNNPQIFTTDVNGQNAVQVTNRGGTNIDPSFSPDGRWILFVGCPQPVCYPTDYEIYAQSRSSSTLLRITNDNLRDHDPYLSPDGSTISWLTELSAGSWDVRIGNLAGAASRTLYGDGAVTSRAVWENSRTLLVHRLARGDLGFQVYRVNSDGSGSQRLTSGSSNEYPG